MAGNMPEARFVGIFSGQTRHVLFRGGLPRWVGSASAPGRTHFWASLPVCGGACKVRGEALAWATRAAAGPLQGAPAAFARNRLKWGLRAASRAAAIDSRRRGVAPRRRTWVGCRGWSMSSPALRVGLGGQQTLRRAWPVCNNDRFPAWTSIQPSPTEQSAHSTPH